MDTAIDFFTKLDPISPLNFRHLHARRSPFSGTYGQLVKACSKLQIDGATVARYGEKSLHL